MNTRVTEDGFTIGEMRKGTHLNTWMIYRDEPNDNNWRATIWYERVPKRWSVRLWVCEDRQNIWKGVPLKSNATSEDAFTTALNMLRLGMDTGVS